jgi:hypothetical protein
MGRAPLLNTPSLQLLLFDLVLCIADEIARQRAAIDAERSLTPAAN